MKILIIGGHLTPALAIIEKLQKTDKILYVGRKYSMEGDRAISLEYKTITEKKIDFKILETGRIQRRFTRHTIPSIARIPSGFSRSLKILKEFKPDVIVGFGGYVGVPIVLAGKALKIPIVLHEQTLEAGLANKFLSKFADRICVSFESSLRFFPKSKTVITGNPIRESFLKNNLKIEIPSDKPIIFVTGGNQGSHFINSLIYSSLEKLLEKFFVIHQTGDSHEFMDFDKLTNLKNGLNNELKNSYKVSKFFSPDEIGFFMNKAGIVISRSGINTVSELIMLNKPALLIPLPSSQKNEQYKNAKYFENLGLGKVIEQKSMNSEIFMNLIESMFENINDFKLVSNYKINKDATELIIKEIYASTKNNY